MRELFNGAHHDYEKGLNSYAFFKTNDRNVGKNLVQDTFMKTWVYLVKKGKIDLMKTFLYHVLNNLIIDQYRKHKTSSLDSMIEKGFDSGEDTTENLFTKIDGETVVLLISKLPTNYQKIMRMKYVQDLSIKEISLITGQSKNTIAVQTHRGLEKLKALYNHS